MSASISSILAPIFTLENYDFWAVKMTAFLKAHDLWEVVSTGREPAPLPADPTLAQIKYHNDECSKKFKALTFIHQSVSDAIFPRILGAQTAKEAWDKLRDEFQGSERVRSVKLLTLKREFEMLRMKEGETIKQYSSKLIELVNQMRLYGAQVVEKILISLPEKFE